MPTLHAPRHTVNPRYVEPVTVITRSQSVDSHGVATFPETSLITKAVVIRDRSTILKKFPEAAQFTDLIAVIYKGTLNARATNGYSDVVSVGGKRYAVYQLDSSFIQFPGGFTYAVASLETA